MFGLAKRLDWKAYGLGLMAAALLAGAPHAALAQGKKDAKAAAGAPAELTPKQIEEQRKKGMAEAPAAVQTAGLANCTVADARLMGEQKNADKTTTKYFEVACQGGPGYVVAANPAAPAVYDCIRASQPLESGQPNSLACKLPGNADLKAQMQALVSKQATPCTLDNYRAVGAGKDKVIYEVACQGGGAYVVLADWPPAASQKVELQPCIAFKEDDNVACKLTSRATLLQAADTLMSKSKVACQVKDRRYVLSSKEGSDYFEVACADGKGYMVEGKGAQFVRTINCADASFVGGGCTLTDAIAAQTEQAGLYTKLIKQAGYSCDVTRYRLFVTKDPRTEALEFACTGAAGGVAILPAQGKGQVIDCIRGETQGYRCTFTKPEESLQTYVTQIKATKYTSCVPSAAKAIGRSSAGDDYVEVACADGTPGVVFRYAAASTTPSEVLTCGDARGIGSGCQLPTNKRK